MRNILTGYWGQHRDMTENLCEIVLLAVMVHMMAGKPLGERILEEEDQKNDHTV